MVTLLVIIVLVFVVLGLLSAGVCWYIANRLLRRTSGAPKKNISVIAVEKSSITLQKTKNTKRVGTFGIQGTDGQAMVGPILTSDEKTITRPILNLAGAFFPTEKIGWNTTVYGGRLRDSLSLPIQEVAVPDQHGQTLPAWFVPGSASDAWVLLVHGTTGTREQTLRAGKTFAALGLNLLAISYRGDIGAPASLSHLGDTEWQDLEAAVQYALNQGARRIVLAGWSLGGTIVETFLDRSQLANRIQAVVLDSPVLDWQEAIKTLTRKNKLPGFIAAATAKLIEQRTGVRLADLKQTRSGKVQSTPTLLFHGERDATAPIRVSDLFASSQASVTYYRIAEADHTQCWNADPAAYEMHLKAFLMQILAPLSVN
jgi:alpha-beta hydrolase superfamily lysophospholipase